MIAAICRYNDYSLFTFYINKCLVPQSDDGIGTFMSLERFLSVSSGYMVLIIFLIDFESFNNQTHGVDHNYGKIKNTEYLDHSQNISIEQLLLVCSVCCCVVEIFKIPNIIFINYMTSI